MKTMKLSHFKAYAMTSRAQQTHEPVRGTGWGHPLARSDPAYDNPAPRTFGALKGRMRIKGDIIRSDFDAEWESSA